MSIRIKSGHASRARVSPATAWVAVRTVCPTDWSRNTASVMCAVLSSTTRTTATSVGHPAARHGPPHFGSETIAIELALFHDRRDKPVQLGAILAGNLLRR